MVYRLAQIQLASARQLLKLANGDLTAEEARLGI